MQLRLRLLLLPALVALFINPHRATAETIPAPTVRFIFDNSTDAVLKDGRKVQPLEARNVRFDPGINNQALRADRGLILRYPTAILPARKGSVEMWIRLVQPLDVIGWRFFLSDGTHWGPKGMPRFWIQDKILRLDLDGGSRYFTCPAPAQWSDKWMQFVFTWDASGSTQLYCNTRLIGNLRGAEPWRRDASDSFRIGSSLNTSSQSNYPANALIDEVAFYDTVLTEAEIARTYAAMNLPQIEIHNTRPVLSVADKTISVDVVNVGYGRGRGTVAWQGRKDTFDLAHQETKSIPVDVAGLTPGLHRIAFAVTGQAGASPLTIHIPVYVNAASGALPAHDIPWTPVAQIDCAAATPNREVGQSKVVASPLGRYREAGARLIDRMVYVFKLRRADELVRVTITYPDDKPRAAGVACWGPPQEALGSGYQCGDDIALSHALLTRQFVFFSRNRDVAIVIQTEVAGQPAAVASLRVEEAPPHLSPAAPKPALAAVNHRRVGLYWEDPVLARCFGEADSTDPADFELVFNRCLDYCDWIGLSAISYPAYWYTNSLYKSALNSGYPHGQRQHPPDFPRRMAQACAQRGIAYYPSLNIWKLSSLGSHVRGKTEVLAGLPSVNCVDKAGTIVLPGIMNWTAGPLLNALHPQVQKAVRDMVREIAAACAPYDSFGGIDFMLWPASPLKLGGSPGRDYDSSYDDYSVTEFGKYINEGPPGKVPEADRFVKRYQWIMADPTRKQAWTQWRAYRLAQFYRTVAAELAAVKPGAKLGVGIYEPSDNYKVEGKDLNDFLLEQGLDVGQLADNDNISVRRFAQQIAQRWRLRMNFPRPRNLNLANDATYNAPFAGLPGMGAIFHQQYFESAIVPAQQIVLPPPFLTETQAMGANSALRVTQPLATGRDYLRYFVYAVRNFDANVITVGGYVLGTQGAEPELREFTRAFSALPAVPFKTVTDKDDLLVRTAQAEGKTWIYVVNLAAQARTCPLNVTPGQLRNAATGEPVSAPIRLRPYELIALQGPSEVKITGW